MTVLWSDDVSMEIAASPDRVWELVSDVRRMGEWSPVCVRCEWTGGPAGPAVGARFVGYNRQSGLRWSRECEVTACEPGKEFAFRTLYKGAEATRWSYSLEPSGSGTKLTESYEVVSLPGWVRFARMIPGMAARTRRDAIGGMRSTLERIKAAAEAR